VRPCECRAVRIGYWSSSAAWSSCAALLHFLGSAVVGGLLDLAVYFELDRYDDFAVLVQEQALAVHDLEDDFVDVHRVGVGRRVVELPDLGGADCGVLGHRIHPLVLDQQSVGDCAEECLDRALDRVVVGVEAHARLLDLR
jgi:hypothetical protein